MYVGSLSCAVLCTIIGYEYYRSRFLHHAHRSFLFGVCGLIILSVNYFANAGLQGSTDLIWPVYLLLLLTICPYRYMLAWVAVYLAVFGLIHVAEYRYPQLVHYPFWPGHGQFTDRITAFPIPVIGIAIVIGVFRRNYDRERTAVMQRDAEKSRLLSILSHDLRAPFIQVRQYLELIEDPTLNNAEREQIKQTLHQTNDQTLDLVTNLLYWSRTQLQGATVHLSSLPLIQTLENTIAIARSLAMQKGIEINQQTDAEIWVTADADMLQLVVRNLLQNAVKFTPPGGTVWINTAVHNGRCMVTISDNGTGIAPEHLATLFTGTGSPTSGTANEKGVGLGLQLCRDFMEHQGGSISVSSKPGEGSRFTIELPVV